MTRKTQLLVIAFVVLITTAAVSHLVAIRLKLRAQAVTPLTFGATNLPVKAMAAGSSLTFYGVAWSDVARKLDSRMRGWAVPAGSVLEMEFLQRQVPATGYTFLGVSMSDLNENYISDYRAEILPLGETLMSLRATRADWAYTRRVLSQYPLNYLRVLFPTAGRSAAVMVGIRAEFRSLRRRQAAGEPTERAVITSDNAHQENISTWPAARRLRNLGDMRGRASSTFEFQGPKRAALFRFLQRGAAQGKMIVMVFPQSPPYEQELITEDARRRFEALLAAAQRQTPAAVWIRLDAVPELKSSDYYWDLVHLNAPGQALATQTLLAKLAAAGIVR